MDELLKGKLYLQHSAGLGHKPNVVPHDKVDIDIEPRAVEVGWHPVGGFAGKWFAEQTGLGKSITKGINKYPDPTQHWAVLVGDYCHELWMVCLDFYLILSFRSHGLKTPLGSDSCVDKSQRTSIWM
jgi:hypothetical protein